MDEVDEILDQNHVEVEEEENEEEEDEIMAEMGNNESREAAVDEEEEEEEEDDDDGDNDGDKINSRGDEDDDNDGDEDGDEDRTEETGKDLLDDNNDEQEDENKEEDGSMDKIHNYYSELWRNSKLADNYNIYPTAAIPIQTHVNALTMSKGLQNLFLGGSDGYIRKYDFRNTVDGKLSLTILQKHSLTDSVQNAGIIQSYWENEVPQKRSEIKLSKNNKEYDPIVSPVYSLEVQKECLFILSGLENGGITMQGVRYNEGQIAHYFKNKDSHSKTVNILKLNADETKFLSASWDKKFLEWDLSNGNIVNEFHGVDSQISSLELRPLHSTVNINEVVNNENVNSDDDMDSLFGDDENPQTEIPGDDISKETLNVIYDTNSFMTSGLNGSINIWDRRIGTSAALVLKRGEATPPWCFSACWSMDGDRVYAGRRNACVEEFDIKMPSAPSKCIKFPSLSGPVSCIRSMPNNKHLLCASQDNIRLYNTAATSQAFSSTNTPFVIVPGHHGGVISNMYIDPTCRFMISTSGNRGWQGVSTDMTLIYDIDLE